MADIANAPSIDSVANRILSLLGDDDDADDAPPAPKPELEGDDGCDCDTSGKASEFDDDDAEPDADDEAEAPIQPPASWKADAKGRFKTLPRDIQQVIADRERERESHFSKTQQDAAAARRTTESERQAVRQERQNYAQAASQLMDAIQTLDPIVGEGMKTNWAQLAQQNPATAQQKWSQYQQRLNIVRSLQARRHEALQAQKQDQVRGAHQALGQALPFWNDAGKRAEFMQDLHGYLATQGVNEAERNGLTDPRAILVARDAMLYRKLMAQQAQIASRKKQASGTGRVLRPQATSDVSEGSMRAHALAKRATKSGRLDDQAAAILAALD